MSELTVGSLSGLASNSYVIDVASGSQLTQPGMVLQVVSTAKTDTFSTSSTSFTEITGLTASITPISTSNKILVMVTLQATSDATATNGAQFKLQRGSTDIALGDAASSRTRVSFGNALTNWAAGTEGFGLNFLDSPATISSTVYSVEMRMVSATAGYINRSFDDSDSATYPRGVSSLTLMEIAA